MATVPFAREVQDCAWIFDLFACGSDHITQYMNWPKGAELDRLEREVESSHRLQLHDLIELQDGDVPNEVRHYLDIPDDGGIVKTPFLWRLFSVLLAIDRAAEGLNHFSYTGPAAWRNARFHMERSGGFLNKRYRPVVLRPPALFPRAGSPGDLWWESARNSKTWKELPPRGDHTNDKFHNLCRVPEIPGCRIEIRRVPLGLGGSDWSILRIGLVPLISDMSVGGTSANLIPGPLAITRGGGGEFVVGCPNGAACKPLCKDCELLCDCAEAAIKYLAKERVQIIAFPEAVVPDPVVKRIKSVLRELARGGSDFPVVVLAGTFCRRPAGDVQPRNEAIVLDREGRELWRQSKMHAYTMQPYEQQRYGLAGIFGGDPAPEDLGWKERHLILVDVPDQGLRMMVAICEDSAQDNPAKQAIRALRSNLVFTPVMAGAMLRDRGFAITAEEQARDPRCLTIVANSAALPRAEWKMRTLHSPGLPPLGLVGLPFLNSLEGFTPVQLLSTPSVIDDVRTEVLTFACP